MDVCHIWLMADAKHHSEVFCLRLNLLYWIEYFIITLFFISFILFLVCNLMNLTIRCQSFNSVDALIEIYY